MESDTPPVNENDNQSELKLCGMLTRREYAVIGEHGLRWNSNLKM